MTYPPVWKRIINETINSCEHSPKKIKRLTILTIIAKADFEDEGDEEISGEE